MNRRAIGKLLNRHSRSLSLSFLGAMVLTLFQNCSGFNSQSSSSHISIGSSIFRSQSTSVTQTFPLEASVAVNPNAQKVAFDNVMYSYPLPSGPFTLVGLTGSAAIDSGGGSFEEALVTVGFTPSGQCTASGTHNTDGSGLINSMGGAQILYQFIIKSATGQGHSEVNTTLNLPVGQSLSGCAWVMLSGGLNPLTMTSHIGLAYTSDSVSRQPNTLLNAGGEFCYNATYGCVLRTSAGSGSFASVTRIPSDGMIMGLFGSVSAAVYTNPTGAAWSSNHSWYVDSQCSQFGNEGNYGPGNYAPQIPSNAVMLATANLSGSGGVMQQAVNQPMQVSVKAGDCIVFIDNANTNAMVDSETQIHVLFSSGPQVAGVIDGINPNANGYEIDGWACEIGVENSVNVELYLGQNLSIDIGTFTADQPSEDGVAQACGSDGSAYRFAIPVSADFVSQYSNRLVSIKIIEDDGSPSNAIAGSGQSRIPAAQAGTATSSSLVATVSQTSSADSSDATAQAAAQTAAQNIAAEKAAAQAAADAQQAAVQAAAQISQQAAQAAAAAAVAARQSAPVYRYVTPKGYHMYALVSDGSNIPPNYSFEGAVFNIYLAQYANTTALYRCNASGFQFLSQDSGCEGYEVRGVLGYVATVQAGALQPLYRMTQNGDHMEELTQDAVTNNGYTLDGIVGYVP